MSELDSLRQELADLKREVSTLKRTRWITPGALALTLIALMAAGVASPLRQDPEKAEPGHKPVQLAQDITCKSLKVVDASGQALLQLGSDKDGGTMVINGADGKPRVFSAVENTAGFTDWLDPAGTRRASIFVGERGNAEFHLADKTANITTVLQQADSGGYFALYGPDKNARIDAGVDNGGGYMDISDALGNLRQTFYLNEKNIAQYKLLAPDKTVRFLLSGDQAAGSGTAYDAAGKGKTFP
jgi:hypothetical protein